MTRGFQLAGCKRFRIDLPFVRSDRVLRLAVAVGALLCAAPAWAVPNAPNIVVVLMDDMAWGGLSVQMNPNDPNSKSDYHQTPRLEQLAQQGMVFSNAYGGGPMCSPSRAAIMAGKSPAQLQVTDVRHAGNWHDVQFQNWYNGFPLTPPQSRNFFSEEVTIMDALKQFNPSYRGGFYGKYDWQPNMPWEQWDQYNDLVTWQYTPDDPIAMNTITNGVNAFMAQQVAANKPFVTFASHDATKWDNNPTLRSRAATRAYFESLPVGQRHNNPAFAAMYKDADTAIGQVLDQIDALGIANNTYVIFTADQGASADLGNSAVNGPLYEGKGSVYEGGLRVPFIVKGPGIAAGTYSDVKITSADIFSTILDLSGRTLPLPANVEGVSIKPVLTNGGALPVGQTSLARPYGPNGELFFHYPHYTGFYIDDGGGNYHYNPISPLNQSPTPVSVIIDGDYKLLRFYAENGGPDKFLLFNLAQNQLESSDVNSPLNLASQMPAKVEEMRLKLAAWLDGVDASLPFDVSQPVDLVWDAGSIGTTLTPNSATKIWRTVEEVDSLAREEWYAHGSRKQKINGGFADSSPAVTPTRVAANPQQPGLPRNVFDFDGDDGFSHAFFQVSDATRPTIHDADHSATIETWVKFDALTANQLLFESGQTTQGLSLTVGDADGDLAANEVRFRVLGKLGNQLTVTADLNRFADPTSDFIHIAAVVSDAPANRYVELFVNGASAGRVNATGSTSLDWDGFDSASMGRLGLGEFNNGDTVGGAGGSGPLPFLNGNLSGQISKFRFLNTAQSPSAILGHYNAELYPVGVGIQSRVGNASTPSERPGNVSLGAFESADLRVFQERNDVLAAALTVDAVVTGAASITSPGAGSLQLPAGTDFTSYLLHFDPVGAAMGELRTVTGSVTFVEEIIGIVDSSALMTVTDPRLGAVGDYGTSLRGISWMAGDYLTVSSDQKTLSFQLSTMSDQLLEFRVLTDLTTIVPPINLAGDFNGDGDVDALDLAVWQSAFGVSNAADADGDGDSDGADFLVWQSNLQPAAVAAAARAAAAVPEPSSLVLLSLGLLGMGGVCRRSFMGR